MQGRASRSEGIEIVKTPVRAPKANYNAHRPHRSLNLTPPIATDHERSLASSRDVKRRDRLGGLIHEYSYAA